MLVKASIVESLESPFKGRHYGEVLDLLENMQEVHPLRCESQRAWREPAQGRRHLHVEQDSRAIARDLAVGLVTDYEAELPSAATCFMDDFEACIAHLRMPVTHRRATRAFSWVEESI